MKACVLSFTEPGAGDGMGAVASAHPAAAEAEQPPGYLLQGSAGEERDPGCLLFRSEWRQEVMGCKVLPVFPYLSALQSKGCFFCRHMSVYEEVRAHCGCIGRLKLPLWRASESGLLRPRKG